MKLKRNPESKVFVNYVKNGIEIQCDGVCLQTRPTKAKDQIRSGHKRHRETEYLLAWTAETFSDRPAGPAELEALPLTPEQRAQLTDGLNPEEIEAHTAAVQVSRWIPMRIGHFVRVKAGDVTRFSMFYTKKEENER